MKSYRQLEISSEGCFAKTWGLFVCYSLPSCYARGTWAFGQFLIDLRIEIGNYVRTDADIGSI